MIDFLFFIRKQFLLVIEDNRNCLKKEKLRSLFPCKESISFLFTFIFLSIKKERENENDDITRLICRSMTLKVILVLWLFVFSLSSFFIIRKEKCWKGKVRKFEADPGLLPDRYVDGLSVDNSISCTPSTGQAEAVSLKRSWWAHFLTGWSSPWNTSCH